MERVAAATEDACDRMESKEVASQRAQHIHKMLSAKVDLSWSRQHVEGAPRMCVCVSVCVYVPPHSCLSHRSLSYCVAALY